jgi:hypothetical protein
LKFFTDTPSTPSFFAQSPVLPVIEGWTTADTVDKIGGLDAKIIWSVHQIENVISI